VSPDGCALWPEKFSAEGLERIKRNISAADYRHRSRSSKLQVVAAQAVVVLAA